MSRGGKKVDIVLSPDDTEDVSTHTFHHNSMFPDVFQVLSSEQDHQTPLTASLSEGEHETIKICREFEFPVLRRYFHFFAQST